MNTKQQEQLETEQDQPNEAQEQLEAEQYQSDAIQEQLLEIYKLHAQLVSDTSNRRAAINRFYPTVMSGLIVIYFTFLQRKGAIFPDESMNQLVVGIATAVVGYLGSIFSVVWMFTLNSYRGMISRKYEVLKKLEDEFEFQFFRREWELLGEKDKNTPYKELSKFELWIPFTFSVIFILLICGGFLIINPESEALKMILYGHFYPFIRAVQL